jgi:hypothetical protein
MEVVSAFRWLVEIYGSNADVYRSFPFGVSRGRVTATWCRVSHIPDL